MTVENVYTPIVDKSIKNNINRSTIWKKAYKLEELTKEERSKYPEWYIYKIKFDGVTPIQVMKFSKMK